MNGIQFSSTHEIYLPSNAKLGQSCLYWRGEVAEDGFEDRFKVVGEKRSIAGCLDAFTLLSNASPEDVLAFTQRYGVLGIMPSADKRSCYRGTNPEEPCAYQFCYAEPVFVYQALARQARSILLVMSALRTGKEVDPDVHLACFPAGAYLYLKSVAAKMPRHMIYDHIIKAAQMWSDVASYRFRLGYAEALEGSAVRLPLPQYILEFGDWNQGATWDIHKMPWLVPEEVSDKVLRQNAQAMRENELQFAARVLEIDSPKNIYRLPGHHQRPSPLFNVLAYQLTQALTIPEGTYYCSGCKKLTIPKECRNKPRKDKENWTCSAACEKKFKAEEDKKRGQAKKEAKQSAPASQ